MRRREFLLSGLAAAALPASAAEWPVRARVEAIESPTPEVKHLVLRFPEGPAPFTAGQFLELVVPPAFVEDWDRRWGTSHGRVERFYSIASSPGRYPVVELLVQRARPPRGKDVPPGICSTWIHDHVKPGDELTISGMGGRLMPELRVGRPLLLIAGGTGVSPFFGILEWIFEQSPPVQRDIYLFYGVRQPRDLLFDDKLREWARTHANFDYIAAASDPGAEPNPQEPAWTGPTGLIGDVLTRHFQAPLDADAAVAGSPAMIRGTIEKLHLLGIPDSRISHDPLPPPTR